MQKFQSMEHLNSRTSQGFSRTYSGIFFSKIQALFKDRLCFQRLSRAWNFFPKFKDFQGLLKDPMNPVNRLEMGMFIIHNPDLDKFLDEIDPVREKQPVRQLKGSKGRWFDSRPGRYQVN